MGRCKTMLALDAGLPTLLWASIPCTGGSPWQHVNRTFEGAKSDTECTLGCSMKLGKGFAKLLGMLLRVAPQMYILEFLGSQEVDKESRA